MKFVLNIRLQSVCPFLPYFKV